jgi:hypothetical protein
VISMALLVYYIYYIFKEWHTQKTLLMHARIRGPGPRTMHLPDPSAMLPRPQSMSLVPTNSALSPTNSVSNMRCAGLRNETRTPCGKHTIN